MNNSKIISQKALLNRRQARELLQPNGQPLKLWMTYEAPATYLASPCRVISLQDRKSHLSDKR